MKLIAIEEHFLTPDIRAAWASCAIGQELFAHGTWERLTQQAVPG